MKRTIRNNIHDPYSLHDMNVTAFEVAGDDITMRTQSGMVRCTPPFAQVDGYVEFHGVRWDFCYVYFLSVTGNVGAFQGRKMFLKDFLADFPSFGFSVMDETYGYNQTKFSGYLTANRGHCECIIELYHEGDMVFVEETDHSGMAEVILSHDSEAVLYSVPAEVATDLERYCMDFAANWVWHGPENGKYLRKCGENQYGAVYGTPDFIEYLNRWVFPARKSEPVKALGCYDDELPEEYWDRPRFNF